jgi:hypothetical protein
LTLANRIPENATKIARHQKTFVVPFISILPFPFSRLSCSSL